MIEEPRIVQVDAQPIARLRVTVPRSEIQRVMGPGIQEIMAVLTTQGIAPTGPWLTHHLHMDPAVFDFEIGVPVPLSAVLTPTGRVEPGILPAATVARTVYQGPYDGLGEAWGELSAWIRAAGHEPAGDLWEQYVVGPESSPDPAAWRTELNHPLLRVRDRA